MFKHVMVAVEVAASTSTTKQRMRAPADASATQWLRPRSSSRKGVQAAWCYLLFQARTSCRKNCFFSSHQLSNQRLLREVPQLSPSSVPYPENPRRVHLRLLFFLSFCFISMLFLLKHGFVKSLDRAYAYT